MCIVERFRFGRFSQRILKGLCEVLSDPIVARGIRRCQNLAPSMQLEECAKFPGSELWAIITYDGFRNTMSTEDSINLNTVLAIVVLVIMETSVHLECASTTTKIVALQEEPANSRCTHCKGLDGHDQGCRGAFEKNIAVVDRFGILTFHSRSCSRDGHQTLL